MDRERKLGPSGGCEAPYFLVESVRMMCSDQIPTTTLKLKYQTIGWPRTKSGCVDYSPGKKIPIDGKKVSELFVEEYWWWREMENQIDEAKGPEGPGKTGFPRDKEIKEILNNIYSLDGQLL